MANMPSHLRITIDFPDQKGEAIEVFDNLKGHIIQTIKQWQKKTFDPEDQRIIFGVFEEVSDGTHFEKGCVLERDGVYFESKLGDFSHAYVEFIEVYPQK